MSELNILAICGSLRAKSHNLTLLKYAKAHAPAGMNITIADLSQVPFYNADITDKPDAVKQLLAQCEAADGFLFGCPEYNYSLAPALKNALDWASREPDNRLIAGKAAAIMGAGGGMGTSRAQYHLRQVGVFLDLHFVNKPEVFANAFSGSFDAATGELTDERLQKLIVQQLQALVLLSQKMKG
ncbi:NADPH-dependent FMN reductase [Rheinheimera sp. 4Y26]|uniref:NADPH-dependent FMN reductase n=1 Tax=Rheinheimera sp. 4Y26 TaxID=2977811 RepID=UPI0021B0FB52|nr:NADPH-dependent FMN reductase [Rheinheimera sp. 4Y26]MCT6699500.1 NAD(P)H-dependent oxidoreductase [Rheinheimera sp. 4Y26]